MKVNIFKYIADLDQEVSRIFGEYVINVFHASFGIQLISNKDIFTLEYSNDRLFITMDDGINYICTKYDTNYIYIKNISSGRICDINLESANTLSILRKIKIKAIVNNEN
jgi:hypothetical protein